MFQRVRLYFKCLVVNAKSPFNFLWSLTFLGVSPAGAALLDAQGYAAVLTVEASDEPHGVLILLFHQDLFCCRRLTQQLSFSSTENLDL